MTKTPVYLTCQYYQNCEDCQLELIAQASLKEHIEPKNCQTNVTRKHITDIWCPVTKEMWKVI